MAIEPIPATFAWLQRNILINALESHVTAKNIGIGDAAGLLRFTTNHDTVNHVARADEQQETVDVPVCRLDDLLGEQTPTLIKIDVEGYEAQVLAGAQSALAHPGLLALIVELNGSGVRYGFDDEQIHQEILAQGFKTFRYDPFTRRLITLDQIRATSSNTLYVRDIDALIQRIQAAPRFRLGNGETI